MKKFKYLSLFPLFYFVLILSGCNERVDNYYLSLMGESDSWSLSNYEIVLTQEDFKAGNGTLRIKNENEYMTDWFEFITHVVINNKDTVVHHNIESGPGTDLTEKLTGAIEVYLAINPCIKWQYVHTPFSINMREDFVA